MSKNLTMTVLEWQHFDQHMCLRQTSTGMRHARAFQHAAPECALLAALATTQPCSILDAQAMPLSQCTHSNAASTTRPHGHNACLSGQRALLNSAIPKCHTATQTTQDSAAAHPVCDRQVRPTTANTHCVLGLCATSLPQLLPYHTCFPGSVRLDVPPSMHSAVHYSIRTHTVCSGVWQELGQAASEKQSTRLRP